LGFLKFNDPFGRLIEIGVQIFFAGTVVESFESLGDDRADDERAIDEFSEKAIEVFEIEAG
jgi:hypothetical protein